jgi:putative transposase
MSVKTTSGTNACPPLHRVKLHHKHALNFASIRPTKALLFEQLQKDLDDLDNERAKNSLPKLRRLKRRAFEMMIDRLDPFFVSVGRDGPDAALRKWAMLSTGLDVEKPFERLEIDEWLVSLMTIMVDAGVWEMLDDKQKAAVRRARVWISVAIDARTRMIVAMRFLEKAPNAESALATIELAMRDKSRLASHVGASHTYIHSKPRGIAMDNATNFTATEVMAKIVRLGISNINPPAGLAEMRARIERMFGTLKTKIAGYFTGQTFSNIIEKGDYDPKTNSSLNVEELTHGFLHRDLQEWGKVCPRTSCCLSLWQQARLRPKHGSAKVFPSRCSRRVSAICRSPALCDPTPPSWQKSA